MLVSVIQIGNSRGIRIPKTILQQLGIDKEVEIMVHEKELILRPVTKKPRANWAEAFNRMHENEDDKIILGDLEESDNFQWQW